MTVGSSSSQPPAVGSVRGMTDHPWVDFAAWGEHAHGSPLYQHLASEVAADDELVELAAEIENPAKQNLLFAAVQHLLTPQDDLAVFYASRTETPAPPEHAYGPFREFVLANRDEILEIGRTRFTQTNEVGRLAAILPALMVEADRLGEPVHLVEVGAAAGLNLCLDRYAYDFGGVRFGTSDLVLETKTEGVVRLPTRAPHIQRRVGIDLHPVDMDSPDDLRWLESLIWPEQIDRRKRLRAAIRIRRTVQVDMVAADASSAIGAVLDGLPTSGPAIVLHAFTLNQFDEAARQRFEVALGRAASSRSITRIGFEYWDKDSAWPQVRVGVKNKDLRLILEAHPHGEWVRGLSQTG